MINEAVTKEIQQVRESEYQVQEEAIQDVAEHAEEEPNLKGTLIAVMSLGVFIIVTWIIVFDLFLGRF